MLGAVSPLVESLSGWAVLIATLIVVGGKVWATCRQVLRWIDRQESRYLAVDVVVADWEARGLTPQGAIKEAALYRNLADAHTSAIADHKARLDDHDERIAELSAQIRRSRSG